MDMQQLFPFARIWELDEIMRLLDDGTIVMAQQNLDAPVLAAGDVAFTQERLLTSDGWHRDLAVAAMHWLEARGQRITVNTSAMFAERADFATADGSLAVLCGTVAPAEVLAHLRAGRQVLLCPYPADDGAPAGWWIKAQRAIPETLTDYVTG